MRLVYGLYVIAIISGLVFIQTIRLILLYNQVARYRVYWQNRSKESGDFVYLALGDSAAQGIGASSPDKGYVGQIAQRVAEKTGRKVRVINVSVSGAVINDVRTKQLIELKSIKPDLVTIEIGANDIAKYDKQKFTDEFSQLISVLPKSTYVANMPYFQTRPGRRPYALEASNIIRKLVASRTDLTLVDLQAITKERNDWLGYAADLFHPNDRSYKNWTDAFWEKIRGQL